MTVLTPAQLASYAAGAGFTGGARATIVAISLAESGGDTMARGVNVGSVDRGVLQINNVYHAEVADSCAFDPACAFAAGYRISSQGTDFTPWSTYANGAYRQYLSVANAATSSGAASPMGPPDPNTAALSRYMQQFYATANVTQGFGCTQFGAEPAPPAGVSCPSGHFHYGIDFSEALDAPIPSITAGTVIYSGSDNSGFGNHVIVRDGAHNTATYGHMHQTAVSVGQTVQIGTTLGLVDSTGNSTGNHVHVQLNDATGQVFDPLPAITAAIAGVSTGNTTDNGAVGATWPTTGELVNNKLANLQGFDGVAAAIAGAEQMVSYTNNNPITATVYNLRGLTLRGATVLVGLLLLVAALRSLSTGEGIIAGAAGLPEAGARRLAASTPEGMAGETVLHGAQTLGPVAGLEVAA